MLPRPPNSDGILFKKANFVLMLVEESCDHAKMKTRFRREASNGRAQVPKKEHIVGWIEELRATSSVHGQRGKVKSK